MTNRDSLMYNGYEDTMIFENPSFEGALIGVSSDDRAIYSYDKEEHFHEPLPFINEFDIAIREAEKQGGKKLRDAIINVMSNCNYMGVSYKWAAFSDNDINSIFNEVFNNDKE